MSKGKRPKSDHVKRCPISQKQVDAKAAQTGLTQLPTMALVATINTMIGILQDRGHKIRDWDEKDKVVQRMKCIGNKIYILAPREPSETEAGHGETTEHNAGR